MGVGKTNQRRRGRHRSESLSRSRPRRRPRNRSGLSFPLQIDYEDDDEVEQTFWELGREGIIVPLPDAVIACSAMRIGAVVLTHDRLFGLIPGVRPWTTLKFETQEEL